MANNYQSPFDFLKTFGKLWSEKQEKKKEEQKALTFNEMANYWLSTFQKKQPVSPELPALQPATEGVGLPREFGDRFMPLGEGRPAIQPEEQPPPTTMEEFDWAETQKFINAANLLGSNYGAAAGNLAGLKMRDWEQRYKEQEDISAKGAREAKELETRRRNNKIDVTNMYLAGEMTEKERNRQYDYIDNDEHGEMDLGSLRQVKPGRAELHRKYGNTFTAKSIDEFIKTGDEKDLKIEDTSFKAYLNSYGINPNSYTIDSLAKLYTTRIVNPDINPFEVIKEKPKPVKVGLSDAQRAEQQALSDKLAIKIRDLNAQIKKAEDYDLVNVDIESLKKDRDGFIEEKALVDEDYPGYIKRTQPTEMTNEDISKILIENGQLATPANIKEYKRQLNE